MTERWLAVDEKGNDNFATSIYEAGDKGLLVARCNQNGQYPWQAAAILRGLEQNKPAPPRKTDPHCQTCGRTDKEYLAIEWLCNDPWHGDDVSTPREQC